MKHTTQILAQFASITTVEQIPERVWSAAERSVLDTIASLIGGIPTDNARITREAALAAFGPGDHTPWFTQTPSMNRLGALLSNCAAASALDIDDGHRGAAGHPGAAIVPAVLFDAQNRPVGGRQILAAIIIGYDVALRIAAARRMHNDISFASGIWTGYGIAAALARLRGLTQNQMANAIAIAGQEAPQNLPQGACMASSVKGSSPWSTVTASVAVERAAKGATGSLDLLDRDGIYRTGAITAELGSRWLIAETYHKPYASCRYTHPVIDAIIALSADEPERSAPVDALHVDIFPEATKLPNETAPHTLESAQFSIPFAAALAAILGEAAFRPLMPSCLRNEKVLELSARVSVNFSREFEGAFPLETPARVAIKKDGIIRQKHIAIPLGDWQNPLSNDQIESKLFDLGQGVLLPDRLETIVPAVRNLRCNETKPLFDVLAGIC